MSLREAGLVAPRPGSELLPGLPADVVIEALLADHEPPPAAVANLAKIGLTRWDVWRRLTRQWVALAGPGEVVDGLLPPLLAETANAPDPDGATVNLARLSETVGGLSLPRLLAGDPRFAHDAIFLLGLGSLPGDALVRDPGMLDVLYERELLDSEKDPHALARDAIAVLLRHADRERRRLALRRWKRQQFLRIIARDYLLHRPPQTVTREISAVADACVRAALAAAVADRGYEPDADGRVPGLAIIALGKWGSRELNYNSDIDLLCVRVPFEGSYSGDEWSELITGVARDIDEPTAEGRVFRVDFRLRPEGASGALVPTLEACANYYQTHGAAWEAQMLTRARCVGGDWQIGKEFEALAQRVAYGARVGRDGIAEIRRNRERIESRADLSRDVKESRGGIRDIEFTVQLLQLVRGVTDPSVRHRNTWHALDTLARAGALTELERLRLSEAYDFLRRVEHSLQIQPVSPTKLLPDNEAMLRKIARGLHYRDGRGQTAVERFLEAYRSHTAAAKELCDRLFFNPIPLADHDSAEQIRDLLDPHLSDEDAARHLAEIPFADPAEARRWLVFLAHGEPPMRLPEAIQAVFVELLPALLGVVQRMPDPDAALHWFQRFVARAGGRELFYRFLLEHPPAIELLCRIGGFSDALAQTIVDHPEYLDRVIDPRFTTEQPSAGELLSYLAERLAPLKSADLRLDDLRRWRRREVFRIGVQDLLGTLDCQQVTRALSDVAEVCLDALLAEARLAVPGGESLPFAIIGCGKLGGGELHYSSDLDVLFVYQSDDPAGAGIAEKMAQWLTRESERRTRAGALHELDARLRPFGKNSQLARSVKGYRNYYTAHGQTWERLALSRARAVAGDAAVGEAFETLAREVAFAAPLDEPALQELRQIKGRIEAERAGDTAGHLDLKLHAGGIMEIEFLAQILQIQHLAPEACRQNTCDALQQLHDAGVLTADELDTLTRSYRLLRRFEIRLQLILERSSGLLPLDTDGLAAAAKRLGWSLSEATQKPEQLLADLREVMRSVREIYQRRIGLSAR